MTQNWTIECAVEFGRGGPRGSLARRSKAKAPSSIPEGRIPRIARLMALALRMEKMVQEKHVEHYSDFAWLGQVTKARISQILNLIYLSPNIQEEILFLPRVVKGKDPIPLALLQPIARTPDWKKQEKLWKDLRKAHRE